MNRTITITYTAAGEIEDGMLKFTVPDKWSGEDQQNLVAANVEIDSSGPTGGITYGGSPAEGEDPTLDVIVAGVDLDAEDELTFTYSNVTVGPTQQTDVFKVAFDGSDDPREFVALTPDLMVDVGEARNGSGSVTHMTDPTAIKAESTDNTITIVYTAAGDIKYPREIEVAVDEDWSAPTNAATGAGAYTVEHETSRWLRRWRYR